MEGERKKIAQKGLPSYSIVDFFEETVKAKRKMNKTAIMKKEEEVEEEEKEKKNTWFMY